MNNDPVRPPPVRPLDVEPPKRVQPSSRGRIALIVTASMAAGLVVAVALVTAPFIPARADVLTGVVLLGFAVGWAFAGGPVHPGQRPAATLGGAGGVPDRRRTGRTSRVGYGRRARVPVGVATVAARPGGVEHHPGAPADAPPSPAVAGLPGCWPGWPCRRSVAATRPYESRSTRPPTPCPVSWSTWAGTGSNSAAPVPEPPPSSWSPATAKSPRPWRGSRARSPGQPGLRI